MTDQMKPFCCFSRATKPSRRINPTPVSAERPNCKPKSCFTSTPLSLPESVPESAGAKLTAASPLSLQEERELLRRERYVGLCCEIQFEFGSVIICRLIFSRSKLAQQTSSPLTTTPAICTPTKTVHRQGSKVTPDPQSPCPDPDKVTQKSELDLLAELYCTCISGKWPAEGAVYCAIKLQLIKKDQWWEKYIWQCDDSQLLNYTRLVHLQNLFAFELYIPSQ